MSDENRDQIEYWNGPASQRWLTEQDRLDRTFVVVDDALLARGDARPGERAIDLGCGCGATTLKLAARVTPGGRVLGVDVSAPMLDRARSRAQDFANVAFVHADASTYAFDDKAQLVSSRFGSMFFADPVAAFKNLKRALVDGGRIALAVWRSPDDNPWHSLPMRAAVAVLDDKPAPTPPDAPGPFSLANVDRLRAVLTSAGFRDVELRPFDFSVRFSNTGLDDAVDFAIKAGSVARVTAGLDDASLARIRDAVRPVLANAARGDTIEMSASIWLAHAIA
jgi:SAM-dependent methyltransferase